MGYLSAEQALADFAVLVEHLEGVYNISKVISFGGRLVLILVKYIKFYLVAGHELTMYVMRFIIEKTLCSYTYGN